jgi:hypothetical protein
MLQFRFVGGAPCHIGDREYQPVGARASFTPKMAREVLDGGGVFIPEDDFHACGFPEAELTRRASGLFVHEEPSEAFKAALQRAQSIAIKLMAQPDSITDSDEPKEEN